MISSQAAEACDVVVIGAGVIGLAVGQALARAGREVLILEKQDAIGTETSSRNSEVIHAGIYYPTGSLKAELCVRGKQLLYEHCGEHNVPHENIGKLIVATAEEQFSVLEDYRRLAKANGIGDLPWLSREEIRSKEPAVNCLGGIWSPTTGIIDSHAFMLSLEGELEEAGGMIAFLTEVKRLEVQDGLLVVTPDLVLAPKVLVNSAGLDAPELARHLGRNYRTYYAKGHYYTLSGQSPFNHLVYPIAAAGGLGVHVTLDMVHQARFGPDVVWQCGHDYGFDMSHRDAFIESIRCYYPDLDESKLQPGYTGIRPKLAPAGTPASDFVVNGPIETGFDGYVELLGIESPGLTASLAIAERVVKMVC
ncbi:MAG: NAD(P)/FAD-dependent oxidoreductase [Gammaproteobacteria bacterium]|nr:NAD(P)/FAD-dependent oxidoreductase [Gammaproteobacteria bacterium]